VVPRVTIEIPKKVEITKKIAQKYFKPAHLPATSFIDLKKVEPKPAIPHFAKKNPLKAKDPINLVIPLKTKMEINIRSALVNRINSSR